MEFKEYTDIKIFYNDKNLKPDWVEHEAKFSEFHIKRKKKNILLVIGESWTYGESLPKVETGIGRFNFDSQIINCYGPAMTVTMDCDYYQYAVPGNCNAFMFQELGRILEYIWSLDYEKIYVSMQMTEPSREKPILQRLEDHPLHKLYTDTTEVIDFKEWLKRYDEIFFNIYDREIKKYNDPNKKIIPILWKNFCSINTTNRNYNFDILNDSWIKYSASCLGVKLEMPSFYAVEWLAGFQEDFGHKIKFDARYVSGMLNIIEKSNNYLHDNPYHFPHPNDEMHLKWANYLLNKTGWKHV